MMSDTLWHHGLRLPRHRATTAHLASAYPFQAQAGLGTGGACLGVDVLSGGAFAFDPFEAYRAGLVTNPNMLVTGLPGMGKSAFVKCMLYRAAGVFGRWVAIADPKGEYRGLAEALGLDVIDLHPGGTARLNPLDPGPDGAGVDGAELVRRQCQMVAALLGSVLHRELSPVEDASVGWALAELSRHGRSGRVRRGSVTLGDLAALLASPSEEMAAKARTVPAELAREVQAAGYGLAKLLDGSLRGMFDGTTTVRLDWSGPGVVLDLSAVQRDNDAMTVVMVAATAWLAAALARPTGPPRIQVLDEAWCLLASERSCRYLQSCWKLGRAHGVANLAVVHRLSDLRSQADDGTATAKVAMGLLADTQTRVVFQQAQDQLEDARSLLGLTAVGASLVGKLCRGRALWRVGGRTAVVQHVVGSMERELCDTDARMVG